MATETKQMYKLKRPDGSQSTYFITPTKLQDYLSRPGYSMWGETPTPPAPVVPTPTAPAGPQLVEVGSTPGSSDELERWQKQGRVFKGGKWWMPSGATSQQPYTPAVPAPVAPVTQPVQPQFGKIPTSQFGQVYQPQQPQI